MTRLAIRSTIAGAVLLIGYAAWENAGAVALAAIGIGVAALAAKVTGLWP